MTFDSIASNLVPGDANGYEDVFVRDLKLHRTYLVSISSAGVQGNSDSFTARHLRRRPLRGVQFRCQQPGGGRQQRLQRRLRAGTLPVRGQIEATSPDDIEVVP